MEDDVNIEDVLSFYNMVTMTTMRKMRKMVKDDDEDGDDEDGDDEDGDGDGKDESALPGEGALLTVHRHRNLRKRI